MFINKPLTEIYNEIIEIIEMDCYEKMETYAEMTPYELYRFYYKAKKAHKLVSELESMVEVAKGRNANEAEA